MNKFFSNHINKTKSPIFFDELLILKFTLKWLFICIIIGALTGTVSAWFLLALEWATQTREQNIWLIAFLPLAGLLISLMYRYLGRDVVKGNNQLIEEIQNPQKRIPLLMAPLIFMGTIITHLFGGSAGREGSAVQMGGAIADQFTKIFNLKARDRKILLICGISAGFASVFGTPLAGAVFALEVFVIGAVIYEAILPSFLVALIANWICNLWGPIHTNYTIPTVPPIDLTHILWSIVAGIFFGLAGKLFAKTNHVVSAAFEWCIKKELLRPVAGGIMIMSFVFIWGNTEYIGLGLPTIFNAFEVQQPSYSFLIKIILTAITLGAGFKGGEVTPLFFIGATLGSSLAGWIPLPLGLLAGMGFAGVFSAAANTPIACLLIGIELFGIESASYIAISCIVAYLFSGHSGIYGSQIIGSPKHALWLRQKGRKL